MFSLLISPAFAQTAATGPAGSESLFASLMPLVMIFVIFYFLLIRPQQKKMKEHRHMQDSIRRGDKIVTAGGIIGTVTKVEEQILVVEIAEGVKVDVHRHTVAESLSKPEPAQASNKNDSDKRKSA